MTILALALTAAQPPAAIPPAPPAPPRATIPAAVDPARLALAERIVLKLVPPGTYATLMRDQMPAMTDAMMARMGSMTPADMGIDGAANEAGAKGKTFDEAMASLDPAYRERMQITNRVLFDEIGKLMVGLEPRLRAGMARAFARRFDAVQLRDIDAFFATPSGNAFAANYLATFIDPEVMREMASATPEILRAMPAIGKKVEAATAHLPKPKPSQPGAESADTPDD